MTILRLGAIGLVMAMAWSSGCRPDPPAAPPPSVGVPIADRVHAFCGDCHAYPPPESFPRRNWPAEVQRGYGFFRQSGRRIDPPPPSEVIEYYMRLAPEEFDRLPPSADDDRPTVAWKLWEIVGPEGRPASSIANVAAFRPTDSKLAGLLACEMARGELLYAADGRGPMTVIAPGLSNPAHVEPADLDGDGRLDLLVADLGSPVPTDDRNGRVLWLRSTADGRFQVETIATGLGRVCDVQAADFDGDGDLDLVVAVFGWHAAGEILYFEQSPGDDGRPQFRAKPLDDRHGTIHTPIVDLDGDGRPDFIALITQEHEAVVAFLNRGEGRFEKRDLYRAPHPAFGSSGIQVVDLDGDGDFDVLLTNGDVYDSPLLKPYHGVSWLENRGDGPFQHHPLGPLYGAHRAVAGDIDGDGDRDVIACGFLGEPYYGPIRREFRADSLVLFEQESPGKFRRHLLEREHCDYPTLALDDLDGDGDLDIILGRFRDFRFAGAELPPGDGRSAPIVVWENLGVKSKGSGTTSQ